MLLAMCTDFDIREFLLESGYMEAMDLAFKILYDKRLTSPNKYRMASYKRELAINVLKERLVVTCASQKCVGWAIKTGRLRVPAARHADCEYCTGSYSLQAINEMVVAALSHNVKNIVIVGGEPATHEELTRLVDNRLKLKLVDGIKRRTLSQALTDMAWAQVVVIWSRTELHHSTSDLYTKHPRSARIIAVPRRGIVALAETITKSLKER